jgi:serine/threonine-protein kinase
LGWVALGVGVVGVGVGSYFGLQTFSKQKDSEAHCDGTVCNQTGVDLRDEARGSATISTVAFGIGLVGIGVGAILLATSGDSKQESALWLSPAISPAGGSAHFGGAF